ncbi:MAG: hypothetical protein SFY92_08080 [Verrucomicrobiae bacterium]|nr:hypothetical protein [Verrucomicrobiae bacterium]
MKTLIKSLLLLTVMPAMVQSSLLAKDKVITPLQQKQIDKCIKEVSAWAANPVLIKALQEQNAKGPVPGLTNDVWKGKLRTSDEIKAYQSNPAGAFLSSSLAASGGLYGEAFLSAAQGEKVAFVQKTTSYIHKGKEKFDAAFDSGKPWQGKPEFDESSQNYLVQISVPVLDKSKAIGVLTVGIDCSVLDKLSK